MFTAKRHSPKIAIHLAAAGLLTGAIVAGGGVALRSAHADAYGQSAPVLRSLLLFPVANNGGPDAQDVAARLDDAAKMKLATVNKFKIVEYSRHLATVERALDDKELSEQDVQEPFSDDDKDQPRAAKIAERVGTDAFFVGSIDSFSSDAATKTVTMQVTGTVYYTESGRSAKSVGVAVKAKPMVPSEQMYDVIGDAVNDAASQISGGITTIEASSGTAEGPKRHHHWPL